MGGGESYLNFKAYLERIHYHGSLLLGRTLRICKVAHLLAVHFENLRIHARNDCLEDDAFYQDR